MAQQTDDFSLIKMSFDVLIACLAMIGDIVILLFKGVFFVLKKTFSILLYFIFRFVFSLRLNLRRIFVSVSRILIRLFQSVIRIGRNFLGILRLILNKGRTTIHKLTDRMSVRRTRPRERKGITIPRLRLPRIYVSIPKPPGIIVGFILGTLATFLFGFNPYYLYVFFSYLTDPRGL